MMVKDTYSSDDARDDCNFIWLMLRSQFGCRLAARSRSCPKDWKKQRSAQRLAPLADDSSPLRLAIRDAYSAKYNIRSPEPAELPPLEARPSSLANTSTMTDPTPSSTAAVSPKTSPKLSSKRFERTSCAGAGVASQPDEAFFRARRDIRHKAILFRYGGRNPLEWTDKDTKWDPPIVEPIDYAKHGRDLSLDRRRNRERAQCNSRSTIAFGDDEASAADAYWTSGRDLYAGRIRGADLLLQRQQNARRRTELAASSLVLGEDPDYL